LFEKFGGETDGRRARDEGRGTIASLGEGPRDEGSQSPVKFAALFPGGNFTGWRLEIGVSSGVRSEERFA